MQFKLSHAVLLGLVAIVPLGVTGGLITAETTDDSTLTRVAVDEAKHRYLLEAIDPRGILKLGDKPPNDKDLPGTLRGKPGSGDDKPGDGTGTPVGTGLAPKFADANLEAARNKGETLTRVSIMPFSIMRQSLSKSTVILKSPSNDFINTWENRKKDLDSLGDKKRGGEAASIIQYPDGAVFIKESWNKDRDQPVPKATWTDMVNDQWMIVAKQDTKNLKYVICDNIQNINTKDSSGMTQHEGRH
ncbi:hypothetical protein QIS74_11674 [Colletotrichum tabaci]|uniref:Uncharacterized protein n=1 Tax=Colletotrichum tabaci TaxID=1209068 RepID=A0AAV9SYY7_9PEZI